MTKNFSMNGQYFVMESGDFKISFRLDMQDAITMSDIDFKQQEIAYLLISGENQCALVITDRNSPQMLGYSELRIEYHKGHEERGKEIRDGKDSET